MQIASRMSEALGRFLDGTSEQMKVTANNMANIDTPGFQTQGVDFHQVFSGALSQMAGGGMMQAPLKHVPIDGLVARPDGNNVSMDREGLQLAKTQLQFKTGVALLRSEYARTMNAIHADGK